MAAALARALTGNIAGVQRLHFNLFRALTTAASPSLSTANESPDAAKPKRRKRKNLFEVAQFLPNWGIGYKMEKTTWRDVAYEITKINLYKDGRHGKAWGIRYKAGLPALETPVKLSGVNKPGWKYIRESKKKIQSEPKAKEQIAA